MIIMKVLRDVNRGRQTRHMISISKIIAAVAAVDRLLAVRKTEHHSVSKKKKNEKRFGVVSDFGVMDEMGESITDCGYYSDERAFHKSHTGGESKWTRSSWLLLQISINRVFCQGKNHQKSIPEVKKDERNSSAQRLQ